MCGNFSRRCMAYVTYPGQSSRRFQALEQASFSCPYKSRERALLEYEPKRGLEKQRLTEQ